MNRLGRGVLGAQEALERNGNELARFAFDPASFAVEIVKSRLFSAPSRPDLFPSAYPVVS